jgi:hypothetical protein
LAALGDMNWSECQVSEWKGAPQMETGAPMPTIIADGRNLFVAYFVASSANAASDEDSYAVIRFSGVLQHTFGYPNEDAMAHHPLYKRGLQAYAFNEITHSPHVNAIAERNSAIFTNSKSHILSCKHWIVTFHDETLEVVGDKAECLGTTLADSPYDAIAMLSDESDAQKE